MRAPQKMERSLASDYTMQIATQNLIKVVIIINHQMSRYYFCQTCKLNNAEILNFYL